MGNKNQFHLTGQRLNHIYCWKQKIRKLQTNWYFFKNEDFLFKSVPLNGCGYVLHQPWKNNCSKLKMNLRTSSWMHLSPTTIRDLISFYFKSSVRNLFLFPVEKKINRMCVFPFISCSKNSNPVISLTPT